jgi:hypothetical protein
MSGKNANGQEFKVIVLETANLEELKKGHPAVSPDKILDTKGDAVAIAKLKLIEDAVKRPEKPGPRPKHQPYMRSFLGGE